MSINPSSNQPVEYPKAFCMKTSNGTFLARNIVVSSTRVEWNDTVHDQFFSIKEKEIIQDKNGQPKIAILTDENKKVIFKILTVKLFEKYFPVDNYPHFNTDDEVQEFFLDDTSLNY